MITLLENVLKNADGNYVDAKDFQLLDKTLSTWQARKLAYSAIERKESEIISHAVTAMRNGDRFEARPMDTLGVDRCQRDMTLGLRCLALAMLFEDAEMLKDRVLYWQQNIFLAMQLNYQGYKFLGEAIKARLPENQVELMTPYVQMAHEMMSGK
ncbi:phycocyanin beta chain-like [Pseudanabaena sp. lw0831]|uniref:phycobilisome protein n=1 Tax=Pseudanabaena sp. lw0831 TaxID=1357935 RepID=UPI001914F733|nr:phycobilisome protein [Pseudanabaena sp. lw0831]GBO51549.1 phycocyanin beta chain-like [Pseudanabaena sp. lw0831]